MTYKNTWLYFGWTLLRARIILWLIVTGELLWYWAKILAYSRKCLRRMKPDEFFYPERYLLTKAWRDDRYNNGGK